MSSWAAGGFAVFTHGHKFKNGAVQSCTLVQRTQTQLYCILVQGPGQRTDQGPVGWLVLWRDYWTGSPDTGSGAPGLKGPCDRDSLIKPRQRGKTTTKWHNTIAGGQNEMQNKMKVTRNRYKTTKRHKLRGRARWHAVWPQATTRKHKRCKTTSGTGSLTWERPGITTKQRIRSKMTPKRHKWKRWETCDCVQRRNNLTDMTEDVKGPQSKTEWR